jgi:hypothetical protein
MVSSLTLKAVEPALKEFISPNTPSPGFFAGEQRIKGAGFFSKILFFISE